MADTPDFGSRLTLLNDVSLTVRVGEKTHTTVHLYAMGGSILDFCSPQHGCIVNAANTGGITGFGVDERINRAAGTYQIKEARRALNGIPTGTAKSTPAFSLSDKICHIIHACGPVLRSNAIDKTTISMNEKYQQLSSAYTSSMVEAHRLGCRDVAFCLISAGVFRGEETSLNMVIRLGLQGIQNFWDRYNNSQTTPSIDDNEIIPKEEFPSNVVLVGYTEDEQRALNEEFNELKQRLNNA